MQTIDEALAKLKTSKFRAGFSLKERDRAYVREKGMAVIRRHAEDFVRRRLAPAVIPNDGRQTPMRGHPVFIAQHACACCCRGCLNKWYRVPKGVALTPRQQQKIVNLLMAWIERQMRRADGRQTGSAGTDGRNAAPGTAVSPRPLQSSNSKADGRKAAGSETNE